MAKRWTKAEEQTLLQGCGVYGLSWFQRHCGNAHGWANAPTGRSAKAIYNKARRLYGEGGLTRGTYTITQIMRLTGYSKTQIRRAMRALDQKWKRLSPKGAYLIHEDQYDDIVQWLATDYWCARHRLYNCLWCHKTRYDHKGKGLCRRCYSRYIKGLERCGLPVTNSGLLALVRSRLGNDVNTEKLERQLSRGRALTEMAFIALQGAL